MGRTEFQQSHLLRNAGRSRVVPAEQGSPVAVLAAQGRNVRNVLPGKGHLGEVQLMAFSSVSPVWNALRLRGFHSSGGAAHDEYQTP